MSRGKLLLVFVSILGLAMAAPAQVVDASIRLGDIFEGEISEIGDSPDVDVLRFDAVEGTLVTVTAAALKKQLVLPQVEIYDLTADMSVATEASGKKKTVVKALPLPTTGTYEIRITGMGDTLGGYKVKTKEKLGKDVTKILVSEEVTAAATLDVEFDARPGLELIALVKPDKKKSLATVGVAPTLDGPVPADDPIDIAAFTAAKKTGWKITKAPLAGLGTYTLSVENDGADGAIRVSGKLRRVKVKKTIFDEVIAVSGESQSRSLSGTVLSSNTGAGLAGVTISIDDTLLATTDANGNFIVFDPDPGDTELHLDGTAADELGADFRTLGVLVSVGASGATVMPQGITLPDLNNPEAATDNVDVDGFGATTAVVDATGTDPDIAVSGILGTLITLDGVPATSAVDINVTPVDPSDVPMPLSTTGNDLDASSFVTVNPSNAAFDVGAGLGLDVVLPNDRDFPIGTMVDIWSFDHEDGEWVNRSAQTGNQGVVVDLGGGLTQIQASGVITEGGWHAPAIVVDATCATEIIGRVTDDVGVPIAGASVSTSLGNFTSTAGDGTFSLPAVPAYDALVLPGCADPLTPVTLTVLTPVAFGAVSTDMALGVAIVHGGITDVGDLAVVVPTTGALAGLVTDNGSGIAGLVTIDGPAQTAVMSADNGTFFTTGLAPGNYEATFDFARGDEPVVVAFGVDANATTTINIQRCVGEGGETITVLALLDDEVLSTPPTPAVGAKILLIGTDAGSAAGVIATTNAMGEATFNNVDGPYTVTAQVDTVVGAESARVGATLIDISPVSGTIGIPIALEPDDDQILDATLEGTVANLDLAIDEEMVINIFDHTTEGESFNGFAPVDAFTGFYTLAVPSGLTFDVVLTYRKQGGKDAAAETLGVLLASAVPSIAPLGTGVFDFDQDDPDMIPFLAAVPVNYTNLVANPDEQFASVEFGAVDGSDYSFFNVPMFFDFDGNGTPPAALTLPDMTSPAVAGLNVTVSFEQVSFPNFEEGVFCEVVLSGNPASVTFDLPDAPTLTSPAADVELTLAQAEALSILGDSGFAPGGEGLNCFFIGSDSEDSGLGLDVMCWQVFTKPDVTTFELPATSVPMFANGVEYFVCFETFRIVGDTFDFDTVFDADFAQNELDLEFAGDSSCEGFLEQAFSVEP